MNTSENQDPLRVPITEMLKKTYGEGEEGGLPVGENPELLKIHKVKPGKAKGALLFNNVTDQDKEEVLTQIHFEPFQLGYIDLVDEGNFTAFNEAAENENRTEGAAPAEATPSAMDLLKNYKFYHPIL